MPKVFAVGLLEDEELRGLIIELEIQISKLQEQDSEEQKKPDVEEGKTESVQKRSSFLPPHIRGPLSSAPPPRLNLQDLIAQKEMMEAELARRERGEPDIEAVASPSSNR